MNVGMHHGKKIVGTRSLLSNGKDIYYIAQSCPTRIGVRNYDCASIATKTYCSLYFSDGASLHQRSISFFFRGKGGSVQSVECFAYFCGRIIPFYACATCARHLPRELG